MERHIVIGYDGSEGAQDALALGMALARKIPAVLVLVNAYYDLPGLPAPLPSDLRDDAERVLREGASTIVGEIPVRKQRLGGRSAARALHETAEEVDADLIVLGSPRGTPPGHASAKSVARQVIAGSPCAVAVAPSGLRSDGAVSLDCIGVGVDGGKEAGNAVAAAAAVAYASHAQLMLMAAVDAIPPPLADYGGKVDEALLEGARTRADEALERARDLVPLDVAVGAARLDDGHVGDLLRKQAMASKVDLLVVGSRGFGPLRRVLLGSVSSDLMRDAPCALMVVPRDAHVPEVTPAMVAASAETP